MGGTCLRIEVRGLDFIYFLKYIKSKRHGLEFTSKLKNIAISEDSKLKLEIEEQ